MGCEEYGSSARVRQVDKLDNLLSAVRIEVAGRLVRQEDLRFVHKRSRDRDPLLLPAGELLREVVQFVGESNLLEYLEYSTADLTLGESQDLERHRDILFHGSTREEFEVLEHHTDVAAQVGNSSGLELRDVGAVDEQLTPGRAFRRENHLQESRLSCAGRAAQENEFAFVDFKVDVDKSR